MDNPCHRCGKCCMHMRRFMLIERSIGDTQHFCRFSLTKERFQARIGGTDLILFRDMGSMGEYPDACPFLRQNEDGFLCTIYSSRPGHCRNFFCS